MEGAGARAAPFWSHFGKGLGGRLTGDLRLQQRTSEWDAGPPRIQKTRRGTSLESGSREHSARAPTGLGVFGEP